LTSLFNARGVHHCTIFIVHGVGGVNIGLSLRTHTISRRKE
jgi:hypothetical protein